MNDWPTTPAAATLKEKMASYERELIRSALAAAGWNQRRAASSLQVLPTTLLEKMRRLGIRNERRDPQPADGLTI